MSATLNNQTSVQATANTRNQEIFEQLVVAVSKEAAALSFLASHLPPIAIDLVEFFSNLKGKVVFTGIGKSGIVAQKGAATFSGLGIPAFFLHPLDALHGDLGAVQQSDCLCIFSKSGRGDEFEGLCSFARARRIPTILFCCSRGAIANLVDVVVDVPCANEACVLNLAPTCSTTSMMALSDALAVTISWYRGITQSDFALYHPAGTLGKKLLLTVGQIMHDGDRLPLVSAEASFKDLIVEVTTKKLGCAVVVDGQGQLAGVITDGDIRRGCERGAVVFSLSAKDLMSQVPKTIFPEAQASKALTLMESHGITSLVVVDQQRVVGVLHIHDLIKAGIKE